MASQLKKTRTITDKLSVKGILSDDATFITYLDESKEEKEISLNTCLDDFKGCHIELNVSVKSEEDLLESEELD